MGWKAADLSASYLSDALGDLVTATVALPRALSTVRVSWAEEPGEYRWLLERTEEQVSIRILWFDTSPGRADDAAGRCLLDASCVVTEFQRAVAEAAHALLARWGASGYRDQWVEHDFPTDALARLDASLGS